MTPCEANVLFVFMYHKTLVTNYIDSHVTTDKESRDANLTQ